MDPLPHTARVEESEPDALPPWASGVVRTLKAPPSSGLEWASAACIDELVAEMSSDEIGLSWLRAPGIYVVQIDSLDDVGNAVKLRQLVNDPIAMFVAVVREPIELELALLNRLAQSDISVSHHHGPSSRDNAAREMKELLEAGVEGIDNLRRFSEDIARDSADPGGTC